MKGKITFIIIATLLLSACGGNELLGNSKSALASSQNRYIVTFEAGEPVSQATVKNNGGQVLRELPLVNGLSVLLPQQAAVHRIKALKGIKSVEVDILVHATKPPTGCIPWPECKDDDVTDPTPDPEPDPTQEMPWGVLRIGANLAWQTAKGAGVKVAVLDTGIYAGHPDLIVAGGVNFVSKNPVKPANPNQWSDDNGHGTHVAGIIAALDNTLGVVGVAPEAKLFAVKVLDKNGSGYVSDIISGLEWAMANGMQVVNMSLGTNSDVPSLHMAVDAAANAGLILVAAAGNDGDGNPLTNEVDYPGKYASVIAVGATDSSDVTPYWSSEGSEVELFAPGVAIYSTWNDGSYNTMDGTSMATPHVAGSVALLLSAGISNPRALLMQLAEDLGPLGFDDSYGYGLVNPDGALGL